MQILTHAHQTGHETRDVLKVKRDPDVKRIEFCIANGVRRYYRYDFGRARGPRACTLEGPEG